MKGTSIIKEFCKNLPSKPGVYKLFDEEGKALYIGKAKNLKKRVVYYTKPEIPNRLKKMVFLVRSCSYILTTSEAEAFLLEASQIKQHKPKFNILLKDDKSFPYIKISTNSSFPQIFKYRGKTAKEDKIFGPFASVADVERTIGVITKIFKIRTCSDSYFSNRKRPCLQYQIKRCTAPCVGKISQDDYSESIQRCIKFLSGKTSSLQKELAKQMEEYADKMEFEKAAEIRDNIKSLSYIQQKSGVFHSDQNNCDVIIIVEKMGIYCISIFFYRNGQSYGSSSYFPKTLYTTPLDEVISSFIGQFYQSRPAPSEIITNIKPIDSKAIESGLKHLHQRKTKIISPNSEKVKEIINYCKINTEEEFEKKINEITKSKSIFEEIKDIFRLNDIPSRIEAFDNSHIMGKYAVGSMIVASIEGFEKNEYRKYTIHTNTNQFGGDDYQMLREVLNRRIKRFKTEPEKVPSLMIIDGGKSHMNEVKKLFDKFEINIPFVCMAKGEKRDAGNEIFHMPGTEPFTLDNNREVMKYLQILRDEVHNFVIKSHRGKRSKALSISMIDKIPNIGKKRKKALLNYFGSTEALKNASIDQISKTEGISRKIAEGIYSFFNN